MKDLIDAAVRAAAGAGVRAAVVIIEGNGHAPVTVAPVADAPKFQGGSNTSELEARIAGLTTELQAAREAVAATAMQGDGRIAQLEEAAKAAGARADAVVVELAEARAEVERLKAMPVVGVQEASGSPAAPTQDEVPDFDVQPVKMLGMDAKIAGRVERAGCHTVGDLRKRYLEDAEGLRAAAKLTKDNLIAIGMALAGKAPSMSQAAVSSVSESAVVVPAADVPQGHADRPWVERYQATRAKVVRMEQAEKVVKDLREKAAAEHSDAAQNGALDLSKLPEELADKIRAEEGTYNVVRGQVIAGIWHCGLDPMAGTLDAAIERAGIDPASLPVVG